MFNAIAALSLGSPFCYFIAYRNISKIIKRVRGIKKNRILIIEDILTDKYSLMRDGTRLSCQIELKDYAKRTGKMIWVETREYNRARKGDVYYVVYVKSGKKELFFDAYAAKEYDLDDSLKPLVEK